MRFSIGTDANLAFPIEKNEKMKKNFFAIFGPSGVAPSGPHKSAQGSKMEKRLGDVTYFAKKAIHATFHGNRPSTLLCTGSGLENRGPLIII